MNAPIKDSAGSSSGEAALNIFAVVGFVSLLIAGLWASITFIEFAASSFSGSHKVSFSPFSWLLSKNVELTAEKNTVSSGDSFILSWTLPGETLNATISYPCTNGLLVKVSPSEDSSYAIPCGAPFSLPKTDNKMSVTPVIQSGSKNLTFKLSADGATGVTSDSVSLQVVSEEDKSPVVASKNKPTDSKIEGKPVIPQPTKPVTESVANVEVEKIEQKPYYSDLSVRILSIGKTTSSGQYISTQRFSESDVGSVTFEVLNRGNTGIKNWTFNATLPTDDAYVYTSEKQKSLPPNAKATLTMSFDQLTIGTRQLTIMIDPQNQIKESDERNNSASVQILVK